MTSVSTPQNFEVQPLSWVVKPKGAELFAESVTRIVRDDEGAGQYIRIQQTNDASKAGEVRFDPEEWPAIRQAVEAAFDAIRADEGQDVPGDVPAPPSAPPQAEPTGAELVGKLCWVRFGNVEQAGYDPTAWEGPSIIKQFDNDYKKAPYGVGMCRNARWAWYREAKLYREGVAP